MRKDDPESCLTTVHLQGRRRLSMTLFRGCGIFWGGIQCEDRLAVGHSGDCNQ